MTVGKIVTTIYSVESIEYDRDNYEYTRNYDGIFYESKTVAQSVCDKYNAQAEARKRKAFDREQINREQARKEREVLIAAGLRKPSTYSPTEPTFKFHPEFTVGDYELIKE